MNPAPNHIPEHELLEFIEETLPPERSAAVRAALARDPRLARLVAGMRADRRALAELGDVRAPAGMTERVESILERQALFGLSEASGSGRTSASLPVSQLTPSRGPVLARIRRSRAGRAMAAAACLALLGGGVYLSADALRSWTEGNGPKRIAVIDSPTPEVTHVPLVGSAEAHDPAPAFAAATDEADAPTELVDGALAQATEEPAPALVAAAEADEPVELPSMSPERALQLARAGRLAILVKTEDADHAGARIASLARTGARVGAWQRIDDPASTTGDAGLPWSYGSLALLWSPPPALPTHPLLTLPPAPIIAGERAQRPYLFEGGPARWAPEPTTNALGAGRRPAAVYVATVDDRESVLASLLAALRSDAAGARQSARFVPLPAPIDAPLAADPESVLWWAAPTSSWGWKLHVPVIIDGPAR